MNHHTSKRLRRVAGLLGLALLTVAGGCATSPVESDWIEPPPDALLAQDVRDRLRDDGVTGRYAFSVTADRGVVILTGVVPNDMVRARAVGIALGTPGVVEVVDEIRR